MLNYVLLLNLLFTPHSNLFLGLHETCASIWSEACALYTNDTKMSIWHVLISPNTSYSTTLWVFYVCWEASCYLTSFLYLLPPYVDVKKEFENRNAFFIVLVL